MRITLTIRSTLAALLLLCSNSTYAAQANGLVVGESVLATVLNTEIRAVDVMPSEEKRQDMKEQAKDNYAKMLEYVTRVNASNKIFELVLEDYAKERAIALDQTLVNKFIDKFKSQVSSETSSKPIEEIAVKQVMQFQAEKAMFEEFGGRVVFRQSNPQMPIDGYNELLSHYRDVGKLNIVDEDLREAFWDLFKPPYQYEIANENVDFSKPWWL
ncbi:hypothetical protein [Alteromonas macleodii]|uniref:Uncharacterized protein n=1 Tax=Alteromonas macleodii TaxID=28108 RepID=A0A6T9Y5L5_ALTMA|nr:hypothetical protein [Alteromonas macleodii]CAB9495561.1 conserved exported protein of unknown function [Alteromonas macleodii]